jgi:hypothetical protein
MEGKQSETKFNETSEEKSKEAKSMKRTFLRKSVLAVALIVLAAAAGSWPVPAAGQTADTALDPAAISALDRMGAYLRTLKVFQVEAATEREDVLENGLKVQFNGVTILTARKPDRLRVDVSSDRQDRQYLYNGKQFTLWAQRVRYYATVPAPPTIGELINALDERFGIEAPLVDLFHWGTEAASGAVIKAAVNIGPSRIGDANCQHYAFQQDGFDWQIWIQNGDFPLPRKLVLTTTTDEARPQFQATYTWNMTPTFSDADFTFDPPADALRIIFDEISPETGAARKEK